jgi:hypothetical protein
VGFSGLSRGIRYTLPSVQRHVFDVLRKENFEFDVIWSSVINPDFFGHKMNEIEFAKTEPCLFSVEPQEVVELREWKRFCSNRGYDCRKNHIEAKGQNFSKLMQQLYTHPGQRYIGELKHYLCSFDSQYRLAAMIRAHALLNEFTYDAVLMIRPDVAFIRDIDLPDKFTQIQQKKSTLWVPDFQHFGGLNDRAAFGSQEAMLKYLERGDTFMNNNTYGAAVAELFLQQFIESEGMLHELSSMRFLRVRPMEYMGTDLGIIDGFDIKPKFLNVQQNDPDLLRCGGQQTLKWLNENTKKVKFEFKSIQEDVC